MQQSLSKREKIESNLSCSVPKINIIHVIRIPKAWLLVMLFLSKDGGVSKSMLKKSRLDFDKIEKCE